MNNKGFEKFSINKRIKSAFYALNGLKVLLREEHNSRIHVGIAVVVIGAGFLFGISATEWMIVCLLIALVFGLEIMNSAIENLCDYISPEWREAIKKIKDLAAAAVFVASVVSVICGAIIFLPRICDFF
ncbi:undecaprenol kinase/diacylglycerol kinase (ATP) [Dysgonomonas hofstadii]|uniref:Undecaprenol kinase/diacylglycerol kinase (ATP) n=1 Tax=Dysgonomonas hofstadii TaxID=637886 RepID=A0A840CY98_9BACT|nr:diacylglycerol kinase family protein [Dysgonomonas hofstadii]MBB4036903.1 undecaprenol kinase/diacylglycerol kinase (ATP) [Dysgonomonas hofstadii]